MKGHPLPGAAPLDPVMIPQYLETGQGTALRAAHYATLGFALVPIAPRSKRPYDGDWQNRPLTIPDAAWAFWTKNPQHNLGLLHGSSGTAALDVDHLEGARLALAEIGADLDDLMQDGVRIRGAKGEKPLYDARGLVLTRKVLTWPHPEVPGQKMTIFELRAGPGCQDVLPPSIHPNGMAYAWTGRTLSSRADLEPLPEVLEHLWTRWDALRLGMEEACPWSAPQSRQRPTPASPNRPSSESTPYTGESVISAYNERHTAAELLERHGYRRKGERWTAPTSESGTPGVVLLEGKAYSHHASDLLNTGHAHDTFALFTLLEHGGDVQAAVRAAARLLDLVQCRKQAQNYQTRMLARLRGMR